MRSFSALKLIAAGALAILAGPALTQQSAPQPPAAPSLTAPNNSTGAPLTKADVDAWLDGYIPYALKKGDGAGAVVVVVKDGVPLTQRGYGYADVASRKPVDPETTLFRQASVSKVLTWTAVMQLVEQGKIDLDKDINTYLDFKIPPLDGKPITMRNLMTHTGGFDEAQRGLFSYDQKDIPPLAVVLKRWMPKRIYAPGTVPAYSNFGTSLAGYIVERVSGVPYDDYMERNVFAPAGMTHSSYRQPLPAPLKPLLASGYNLGSGKPVEFEYNSLTPAGALTASGADMGRFMIAHLNNGGSLLKPATALQMHTTALTIIPPLNRMMLGFYEQNINGHKVISHAGDTPAFHSQLWMFPEDKVGIYISMNAAGAQGVTGPIRSQLLEGFADRYFPGQQNDGRVDDATAKEHARMMVGTYNKTRRSESTFLKALEITGQFKITLDAKGGIVFSAASGVGGQTRKWVEIAPFVWRDAASKMRLAAKVENGKVVLLGVDSSSPFMMFQPVPWYSSTAWLTPGVLFSLGALLLTALAWPIAAIVRRRYGAKLALTKTELRGYRLTRIFAALAVIVMLGWIQFILKLLGNLENLSGKLDWALISLQIATPIITLGLIALSAWNLLLVWKGKRGWFSKLWSIVILLSAVIVFWVAVVFHLISFGVDF